MHTLLVATGLVLAGVGCLADGEVPETQGPGGGGKGDGTDSAMVAPTYAFELVSSTSVEDQRESDPAKRFTTLTMRAHARVTAKQTGDAVALSVQLCNVTLPIVSGYQPQLDASFVATVPALQLAGRIAGGHLSTAPAALVLGAHLEDPIGDALPATGTDGRVRDQDLDGKPGISIRVPPYGSIYAALRVGLSLDVPLTSVDAIAGSADVSLDQAIYGDSIPFYDAAKMAAETAANVSVVSTFNTVRMKRGATTCEQVVAAFP